MDAGRPGDILDDQAEVADELIDLPPANKDKGEKQKKVEKPRFRAWSLGAPRLALPLDDSFSFKSSTGLMQDGLSSSRVSPGAAPFGDDGSPHFLAPPPSPSSFSSSDSSPHLDSPRERAKSSERRRKEGSPRISVMSKGGGSAAPPSPKITTPKHSPRIEIKSSDQDILEGELPVTKDEAALLLITAMERYKEYRDDTKRKKEEADENKQNGFSILVTIRTKTSKRHFWLIVTGNYRSGSEVYLVNPAMKLGEGASASTFMAYDLRRGTKVAARALNKTMALKSFSLIIPDITRLIVAERFAGLFFGELGLGYKTYVVFLPYVPGKTLIDHLYKTNLNIKNADRLYKDVAEYYEAKIQYPYVKRFDSAIATVKALQVLHDKCIIHRDISGDNLLIDEKEGKLSAELVDFDEMVDMGCDVFASTVSPAKENLSQFLSQFLFDSNAAYIRVGVNELHYVNKYYKSCVQFPTEANLGDFDSCIVVSDKARRLSQDELQKIAICVNHTHTPPKIKGGLNAAYGYASPELCKLPAEAPGYKSDLYMLGVLLFDIFDDGNIQQELRLDFKVMMVRNDFHRIELLVAKLKKMSTSVFVAQHPVEVFDPAEDTLENFVSRYIYRRFMLPKIRKWLEELLAEDPAARLYNSSLQELHKHLSDRRQLLVRLTGMLMSILSSREPDIAAAAMRVINAVAVMQDAGLRLKKLAPFMREESSGKMTALDELLKEKESESASRNATHARQSSGEFLTSLQLRQIAEEEAMQAELQRVKERHQRRVITYAAMESLILGWEQLKDDSAPFELLESLVKCLFHTGKTAEVIDFMKQLKLTVDKEEKIASRR